MDVLPGAKLMQLVEWGFPMGVPRPTHNPAYAWSVIHITGNSRLPSAENEAAWRINDPRTQNSATFFVNRDGSIVQTLGDPLHMDPYANGDYNAPNRSNPRIAWWYARRHYYNANELTLVAIENVGYEPGYSITQRQIESNARIIAYYHAKAGVPVSREAVIGHHELNSVTRPNCPARDKSVIDEIVRQAQLLGGLPDTALPEGDPMFKYKAEGWSVADGGATITRTPDGNRLLSLSPTIPVTTVGETEDGRHRLVCVTAGGENLLAYVRRTELLPLVAGGDPAFNDSVWSLLLSRKAPTPTDCSAIEVQRDEARSAYRALHRDVSRWINNDAVQSASRLAHLDKVK